jgi:Protein of unknown function (DUF2934)
MPTKGKPPVSSSRKTEAPAPAPKGKSSGPLGGNGNTRADLSPEQVYLLIQETAYFKAKERGFAPGGEVQDWIEAEAEVRRRIGRSAP